MAEKVDPKLAAGCVALYEKMYQSDDIASIKKAYTANVSFSVEAVRSLLVDKLDTDRICIKLGIYTKEFIEAYPETMGKEGRLTSFLYTDCDTVTDGGGGGGPAPQDPLNLGELKP
ncbi:hypothetical protein [Mucilaginibacter paludis]|uniref:Uncharacterized protein n=1 Tax=Mucilaginibacter paludis DSM 18603 TaxID=714943 RepID=H1YFJ5_9SPHI|nr:hypothetical protein [Mucilaginibacter paludis]EHQ27303.1 hypothetical protein Mucpa_3199 [Mucilaginibacter paludis DSM 18603]